MEQTKSNINRICYAAGQSGGHIIPCITLAQQRKESESCTIIFFCSNGSIDQKIFKNNTNIDHCIPLSLSGMRSWYTLPFAALRIFWATVQSFYYLSQYKPNRIISTGGIVAIPVCLAGWFLRIPIELYELNATPGKATSFLARFATKIHVCFSSAKNKFPKQSYTITPYPIRFEKSVDKITIPHFSKHRFTLFVQGGSQGSLFINNQIKACIETYPDLADQIQIIHQTGSASQTNWHRFYEQHKIPAHIFAYDHNIAPYYQNADLVICRSGAGAIFETVFFKKPCILIPLETKTNRHQLDNARAIAVEYPKQFHVIRQNKDTFSEIHKIIQAIL